MDDGGGALWLILTVGGILLLGLAIAYAALRNRSLTRTEKARSEAGTAEVYAEEQRAKEN